METCQGLERQTCVGGCRVCGD
ncbi:hypothetical protein LINPERPRIM_LOCUS37486 [Linum perenne]